MLQRVSFPVGGTEIEAILHLPDGESAGGVVVLHGRDGQSDQLAPICDALADVGVAALRFTFRDTSGDAAGALADTAGAVRLLRAHPTIPQRTGIAGYSYGGAIAAVVAGRDSRIRAAALIAAPVERGYFEPFKPLAELSRTRARVLIVVPGADDTVSPADGERYAAVLLQARVRHRLVRIEGADHTFTLPAYRTAMLTAVSEWFSEALAG